MKLHQPLINLLLLFIVLTATLNCQKNIGFGDTDINPVVPISISLSGRITDKNHQPVSGAVVKAGTASATTDFNGNFSLRNITINNANTAFVKVEKDGYFSGSRTFQTTAGSNASVAIQLIKKVTAGTFAATSGGSVTVPDNGGKIEFPANSIINPATNAAYLGNISVASFFIDPSAQDFQEMMPGALRGINSSNQEVGLQSFGMMAVELTGAGNEKLQLAPGKTATMTFPIPAGLQAQAPATIPLWSFNDSTALWKQEGTATRQGNNYVGTVSHFSFWNCDFPLPIIKFTGTVVNQNGLPLSSVKVLIKTTDDAISTFGYGLTDSAGKITGSIPANKSLQLNIFNKCGELVNTRNIGPYASTANLGNLIINTSSAMVVRFTGTVINCTGSAVNNGLVDISIDNNHYAGTVVNGSFSVVVSRCSNNNTTASILATDNSNSTQGTAIQVAVTDTIVNTGPLTACGTSTIEFLNYTLSGATKNFISPADSVTLSKNQLGEYTIWISRKNFQGPVDQVYLLFAPPVTNTTTMSRFDITNNNATYRLQTPATVAISENGAVGGYIAGSFTADFKRDSSTATYPVSANFRIKRTR